MDDYELIAALVAGDDTALRELFERHAPWLAARLRRALPAHTVEDVLQETFLAVWRGAGSYRGGGEVGAWIWGIAARQAALWTRRNNRPLPDLALIDSSDPAMEAALRVDLQHAFGRLGDESCEHGELARLVLVEDRPIADAAARLGIPEGTVKSRMHRIRRLLRSALEGGSS